MIIWFALYCLEVTLALFVCVWAIRCQMVVDWDQVHVEGGTNMFYYPDQYDAEAWETDPVIGLDAYRGRVIERHLDPMRRVEREELYRRRMIHPVRPTAATGGGTYPRARPFAGRAPRRSAVRTFPEGVGRPLRVSTPVTIPGPRPRRGVMLRNVARADTPEYSPVTPLARNPHTDFDEEVESVASSPCSPYYTPGGTSDDPSEFSSGHASGRVS